jgi:hypothetical protein
VFTNLFKLALIALVGIANAQSDTRAVDDDGWTLLSSDVWELRHLKVDTVRSVPEGVAYLIRYVPKSGSSPSWERTAIVNCLDRTRYEITSENDTKSREFKARIPPGTFRADEMDLVCKIIAQKQARVTPVTPVAPVAPAPLATPPIRYERPKEANVQVPVITPQFLDTTYQSKDTEACLMQLIGDPKVKPLIGKLAFDLDKPQPLEMLANPSKATPKEKAALNFYSTEWQRCQDLGADWRKRKLGPDIAALFSALQVDLSAGLADLYAGQIAYGSAAKLRAKQWIEFKNGAEATERRHSAQATENEKQRQIQMQRDAAAAQERAAQERSRQQVEANQRRALELQQQQMVEQREMEAQRAAAFKKAESDREWDEAQRRRKGYLNCTTTSTGGGDSRTTCY